MLNPQAAPATAGAADAGLVQAIVQLARDASIEMNVHDVMHVEPSRALLPSGTKVYVSHLPKQTWQETQAACRVLRAAGFLPVPHLPVRLVADEATLDGILDGLVAGAGVEEILLVAGDYSAPAGPYSMVADVLSTGALERHGIRTISMAGHPEGHPKVSLDEIRSAEIEKVMLATQAGLDVSLVTQFFFEHTPFLEWVGDLRARGVRARFVAGVAGPARPTTLLKFALRCGVGPSIRALTARPILFHAPAGRSRTRTADTRACGGAAAPVR